MFWYPKLISFTLSSSLSLSPHPTSLSLSLSLLKCLLPPCLPPPFSLLLSLSLGILSFFAIQSGARKVYCVEASSVSVHCQQLIKDNKLGDKITVIAGKVEEVYVCVIAITRIFDYRINFRRGCLEYFYRPPPPNPPNQVGTRFLPPS